MKLLKAFAEAHRGNRVVSTRAYTALHQRKIGRRKWRIVADRAGLPKSLRNQDSRAGGITEATDAGADLEHVRHAATHSNISMTQRYSRGSVEKTANVMQLRQKHRNKGSEQT